MASDCGGILLADNTEGAYLLLSYSRYCTILKILRCVIFQFYFCITIKPNNNDNDNDDDDDNDNDDNNNNKISVYP